jgi:dTDP-4-amino-4,6-dideoxygalactose transaminase
MPGKIKEKIFVTKSSMPRLDAYVKYLRKIWKNNQITNHGPLSLELEKKLKSYFGVKNLLFVSNGTVALEVAIKALNISGEIITTPFSYVATTSAILWTGCAPVYTDIDVNTLCINPDLIEKAITSKTQAILATHVYGNPCDIEKIHRIANKHNLKVIYDAAHSFGVKYRGKSILNYGDISTISFHATKLFHTAEGGAIVTKNKKLSDRMFLYKSFGHSLDNYYTVGINGKNSELHAAIGLCNLPLVDKLINKRKKVYENYMKLLEGADIRYPVWSKHTTRNHGYFPVIFKDGKAMKHVKNTLEQNGVYPRRYFFPSLNNLPYVKGEDCPVSESIAERVLCLPLYDELKTSEIRNICKLIKSVIE